MKEAPAAMKIQPNTVLDSYRGKTAGDKEWKVGKDGIREKNGKRFEFEQLIVSPDFMRISEPYKNNLRKIGFDMKIRVVQVAEHVAAVLHAVSRRCNPNIPLTR